MGQLGTSGDTSTHVVIKLIYLNFLHSQDSRLDFFFLRNGTCMCNDSLGYQLYSLPIKPFYIQGHLVFNVSPVERKCICQKLNHGPKPHTQRDNLWLLKIERGPGDKLRKLALDLLRIARIEVLAVPPRVPLQAGTLEHTIGDIPTQSVVLTYIQTTWVEILAQRPWKQRVKMEDFRDICSGGSKADAKDARPHPPGPNSFIFMQFSGNI